MAPTTRRDLWGGGGKTREAKRLDYSVGLARALALALAWVAPDLVQRRIVRRDRLAHDADLADGVGPLDAAERAPQGVVARDLHADARGGGVAIGLDDGEIVAVDAHALANPAAVLPCRVVCVHTLLDLLMSIV